MFEASTDIALESIMQRQIIEQLYDMTVWPSGLRRWLQAPVRKGVGSNPTAVISQLMLCGGETDKSQVND